MILVALGPNRFILHKSAVIFLLQRKCDCGPHNPFQQIQDVSLILFDILNIFFYYGKVSFAWVQLPFVCRPTTPKLISGPCNIEKYPFLRMANRYTRIFDVGGLAFPMRQSGKLRPICRDQASPNSQNNYEK